MLSRVSRTGCSDLSTQVTIVRVVTKHAAMAEESSLTPGHSLYIQEVPLAENDLIAHVRRLVTSKNSAIATGIGDDCAVLRLSRRHGNASDTLVTTDFSLEGIHFRRDWHSSQSVGHRCLARGLSDIAAMGGEPVAAFLSLALPSDLPQKWVDGFTRGFMSLAQQYGVTLAGGDTAQSPGGILSDIVVIGTAPEGESVLRSGARPGDRVYVSGELGASAAALRHMERQGKPKNKTLLKQYQRHFFPDPRLRLGRTLREKKLVSAMIDTSDGLSTDLAHICQESGVGAELQAENIPRITAGRPPLAVDLRLALHGGEDYELLFTSPPGVRLPSQIGGVRITMIGKITRSRKMLLKNKDGPSVHLKPQGWQYFGAERTHP